MRKLPIVLTGYAGLAALGWFKRAEGDVKASLEGLTDGAIAIPTRSSVETFNESPKWPAREDGLREGAGYSIRAGRKLENRGAWFTR